MKTAEEIIQQMVDEMPFDLNKSCKPYIREAMEIYAKQVAEATLRSANSNVFYSFTEDWKVIEKEILSTEIQLP